MTVGRNTASAGENILQLPGEKNPVGDAVAFAFPAGAGAEETLVGEDSRIVGAIQYNFSPLITGGLEILNRQLEHPETAEREERILPARFLKQEQFGELETLGRYNFRTS